MDSHLWAGCSQLMLDICTDRGGNVYLISMECMLDGFVGIILHLMVFVGSFLPLCRDWSYEDLINCDPPRRKDAPGFPYWRFGEYAL